MTGTASVEITRRDNVLAVPTRAIKRQGRNTVVEVQVGGATETRTVRTGGTDGTYTEIIDGLAAGDMVVIPTATTTTSPTGTGAEAPAGPAGFPGGGGDPHRSRQGRMTQNVPTVRVRDLTRSYHLGDEVVHALAGVSIDVWPGEFVAIMGASGSGKSTLMNMLGCLDRPTSGAYELDGVDVATMPDDELVDGAQPEDRLRLSVATTCCRASARVEQVAMPLIYSARADREARALARLRARRPRRARAPPADRALGRPAAARRHRARAGHEPAACSSPTSRPATSTAACPRRSSRCCRS